MNALEELVQSYQPKNTEETKLVLREIVQSMVLTGLSKAGFFNCASFYGGTALRLFYGLNRYSEDLDFTLNEINEKFSLENYVDSIKNVAASYGLVLEVSTKVKKINSPVESAFAKVNTYQTFIQLNVSKEMINTLHKDVVMKVKFEIDCHPATGFKVTRKWLDIPEFAPVIVLDEGSLFAGKLHAILCRTYQNTVKGRDYYDFLFYVSRKIKPNLIYLRNKLIETGKIKESDEFNMDVLKHLLIQKFEKVDFEQVKEDAARFTLKNEDLSYYCKELFIQMAEKL